MPPVASSASPITATVPSTHHYYAEDVHDFAWTTSPDFLDLDARFEHPDLPDVDIRLLLQPEHAGQADRHIAATQATLKYFGEWFGAYPYDDLTVVDPAWQSGTGGMEYPTLFTAGSRWLAPRTVDTPEGVTVHEAGHQFFYGVVGNNEFEHAWLDEGLTTFATARALDEFVEPSLTSTRFFGGFIPWVFDDIPWSRATDGNRWAGYRRNARMDAQATPTYRYWPGTAGSITYNKTALWLHTLERHLGWPTLQRAMSAYYDAWRFRHPSPQAFFDAVGDAAGTDLRWFFDQVHGTAAVFDYGVDALTTRRAAARGFFEGDRRPVFDADAPAAAGLFETTVVVRRYGRRCLSGGPRGRVRRRPRRARTVERSSPVDGLSLRARRAGVDGNCRPRPSAAARRRLHEQQPDDGAEGRDRRDEMVAQVDRLAAGCADDVRVFCVTLVTQSARDAGFGCP